MGVGWRRWSELVRQKTLPTQIGAGDGDFVATPNYRNEIMLKEAGDFANHLKRCEKDIRAMKNITEGLLNTTKIVMSAPLPRVYEDVAGGRPQPVPTAPGQGGLSIGGDFRVDDLSRISKEAAQKLEAEVLAPMGRWTKAFVGVQARMKQLEGVRLEVDSRRRTVLGLNSTLEKQRVRLPETKAKGEVKLEQVVKKMQHKENKLAAARQSFKEQEAVVYQQLAQLIRDAVWLKSYIAAVMRLAQEAFQQAYVALGSTNTNALAITMHGEPQPQGLIADQPHQPAHPLVARGGYEQAAAMPGTVGPVTNKNPRRPQANGGGKENGIGGGPIGAEHPYIVDTPAAPTHGIPPRRANTAGPSAGYDRYGEQQYDRRTEQALPAW